MSPDAAPDSGAADGCQDIDAHGDSVEWKSVQGEVAWREALSVPIADPEDRAIVDADFADAPEHLRD